MCEVREGTLLFEDVSAFVSLVYTSILGISLIIWALTEIGKRTNRTACPSRGFE